MTEGKVNMFDKAHEDRRAKFVEDNSYVADAIVSKPIDETISSPIIIEKEEEETNFLLQAVRPKKRSGLYLEVRTDDFLSRLSNITGISKTEIINKFLNDAIMYHEDIKELRTRNKKVQKIFDEFMES